MTLKEAKNIAHNTVTKGRHSELLAQTALLANGYEVAEPIAPEPYDLVARCPETKQWLRVQVKSARVREDRDGAIVVYAKKNNGECYTEEDCDLLIGVLNNAVYLFPCRNLSEYWVNENTIKTRWTKLETTLNLNQEAI